MQISQKTLERLRDKPDKLIEIILSQAAMIEQLCQRIVCLEEQLKMSSAGLAPFRVAQNKRKQNPKQTGGKKGHQASYREIPDQVDQVIQVSRSSGASSTALRAKTIATAAKVLLEDRRENLLEESICYRLDKQRDHLFIFLDHQAIEATNHLAQKQLRPAVIRRKLSCGNKTRQGADSFEVLGSLAATWQQQGISFFQKVVCSFSLSYS